ncbi:hypothetical protein ON021_11915 [Microcoleus sp. HI-ES]|nr:hypothetical protein [Microcoleus sp. HI-ES]
MAREERQYLGLQWLWILPIVLTFARFWAVARIWDLSDVLAGL